MLHFLMMVSLILLETKISKQVLKNKKILTKTNLFVTDGRNGSYYLKDDVLVNIPTINIIVENTLGAGDVWHGAFYLYVIA